MVGDNFTVELGAFTFPAEGGGEEIRNVPFAYVIAKVADLVDQHTR